MTELSRKSLVVLESELKLSYTDVEFALELDRRDKLSPLRNEFFYPKNKDILQVDVKKVDPEEDCVYFLSNSLGLQPRKLADYIRTEMDKWARIGVQGHANGAFPWERTDLVLSPRVAKLVGAKPCEVALMNGLTVNLHLLLISFYQPSPIRHKILIEGKAFPSDHYAVHSQIRLHGYDPKTSLICLEPRKGEWILRREDILDVIEKEGDSIAVVLLPGIQYFTGQKFDIETITAAGHAKGCYVGWDLAHSVGNHPIQLHDWDVDFAVWCSYKYMCSGAGGTAGAFLHEKFDNGDLRKLYGWWGHRRETRFMMDNSFDLMEGINGYRLSNPSILATLPLAPYLDVYEKTDSQSLRAKSVLLTGYLELLLHRLQQSIRDRGLTPFVIITPEDPSQRGSQLSVRFNDILSPYFTSLIQYGIVTDIRDPYVTRMAPSALYNSFMDVHRCHCRMQEALHDFFDRDLK